MSDEFDKADTFKINRVFYKTEIKLMVGEFPDTYNELLANIWARKEEEIEWQGKEIGRLKQLLLDNNLEY